MVVTPGITPLKLAASISTGPASSGSGIGTSGCSAGSVGSVGSSVSAGESLADGNMIVVAGCFGMSCGAGGAVSVLAVGVSVAGVGT